MLKQGDDRLMMQCVVQHGLSRVGMSEVKLMQGVAGMFSGRDPQHHGMRAVLAGTRRRRGVALDAQVCSSGRGPVENPAALCHTHKCAMRR